MLYWVSSLNNGANYEIWRWAVSTRLLRLAEVSERTGIPENTLRHYRATNQGPRSALIGGKIAYREHDIDDWIEAQFEATNA